VLVCPNTVVKDLEIEFSSPSLCRSVRTKASNMNDHEAVIGKITPGLKSTLFRILATIAAVIVLQACNSNGDDNGEIIGFSYVDELDNVYEPFQPELGAAVPVAARAALEAANLPTRHLTRTILNRSVRAAGLIATSSYRQALAM